MCCAAPSLFLFLVSTSYVLREQCIRVFETIFLFRVRCAAVLSSSRTPIPRHMNESFVFGEQRKMDKKIALTKWRIRETGERKKKKDKTKLRRHSHKLPYRERGGGSRRSAEHCKNFTSNFMCVCVSECVSRTEYERSIFQLVYNFLNKIELNSVADAVCFNRKLKIFETIDIPLDRCDTLHGHLILTILPFFRFLHPFHHFCNTHEPGTHCIQNINVVAAAATPMCSFASNHSTWSAERNEKKTKEAHFKR